MIPGASSLISWESYATKHCFLGSSWNTSKDRQFKSETAPLEEAVISRRMIRWICKEKTQSGIHISYPSNTQGNAEKQHEAM